MISEELKSKIVNMLVSYFTAIMKNNMDEVKHFIKEQPLLYGTKIVEEKKELFQDKKETV